MTVPSVDRRTLLAICVVGAVLVAGGWGLFGYDPTTPAEAPYEASVPNESYEVTRTIWSSNGASHTYTMRTDLAYGEQLVRFETRNLTRVTYWRAGQKYTYIDEERGERFQDLIDTLSGRTDEVVRRNNTTLTAVLVGTEANPPLADRPQPNPLTRELVLWFPLYERTGTTMHADTEVAVYTPGTAWVAGTWTTMDGIRVTNVSGVAYVDPETIRLYYANVTFDWVEANSWGDYLHGEYIAWNVGGTAEVVYVYNSGGVDVERPLWAKGRT